MVLRLCHQSARRCICVCVHLCMHSGMYLCVCTCKHSREPLCVAEGPGSSSLLSGFSFLLTLPFLPEPVKTRRGIH